MGGDFWIENEMAGSLTNLTTVKVKNLLIP
jgi:hypothetical protein